MTTGWRAPAAGLRHAPVRRSALSRSPGPAAGQPAAGAADGEAGGRSSIGVALIGALFIHRLDGQLGAHLPASGAGYLSAAQVSSITPQGLAQLPAPLRHVIASAFAQALPPLYAYLIPLLAAAFVLALILKEIPLRTRAQRDAAQAAPAQPGARPQGAAATSPGTSQPSTGPTASRGHTHRAPAPPAASPLE